MSDGAAPPDEAITPFVVHVVEQSVHRLGGRSRTGAVEMTAWMRRMLGDIGFASAPANADERDRRESAARTIAADAALLAAYFQSIDLLYANSAACADAASAVLMRAMELSRAELDTSA